MPESSTVSIDLTNIDESNLRVRPYHDAEQGSVYFFIESVNQSGRSLVDIAIISQDGGTITLKLPPDGDSHDFEFDPQESHIDDAMDRTALAMARAMHEAGMDLVDDGQYINGSIQQDETPDLAALLAQAGDLAFPEGSAYMPEQDGSANTVPKLVDQSTRTMST